MNWLPRETDMSPVRHTLCSSCEKPMQNVQAYHLPTGRGMVRVFAECCVGKHDIVIDYDQVQKLAAGALLRFGHQGQWRVE